MSNLHGTHAYGADHEPGCTMRGMNTLSRWVATALVVGIQFVSVTASAGDCPECTSSSDCGGGFCVRHNNPVGCGTRVQICCPGQGCRIEPNGRPLCENQGTCVVVSGPGDAGRADVPPATSDAAIADSGTASDLGTTTDGGAGVPSEAGCGCRVGSARTQRTGALLVCSLAALALASRKRRGRSTERATCERRG